MRSFFTVFLLAGLVLSCSNEASEKTANDINQPANLSFQVVAKFPHDTASFTEGLLIHDGRLFESTGGQCQLDTFKSWLGEIDLATGKAKKKLMLDTAYFGEGITILNSRIYQLTYQDSIGFVYDASSYKKLSQFKYDGEGWSLTNDGTNLIMSDGSSILRYLDPLTLHVIKKLNVEDHNGPVANVNELEYIDGYIYANQYLTNYILKIEASSGQVIARADLTSLEDEVRKKYPYALELNGIAYDSTKKIMFVNGKAWPYLYQIRFYLQHR